MAYIRTLNQADWFFNPGKTPGGLEPTGAAAPALPGSPAPAPPPPPAPSPAPTPAPDEAEEGEEASSGAPAKTAAPPVLEKKGAPIGLYFLGGAAVLAVGIFLYKKFGGSDDSSDDVEAEVEIVETRPSEPETTITTAAPSARRKKNRK